jgi:hypothetical protein
MAKKPEGAPKPPPIDPAAEYAVTFKQRAQHGRTTKFVPGRQYVLRGRVLQAVLDSVDTVEATGA